MMKSIYKLIMVAGVLGGTGIAVAGTQFGNYSLYIDGEGGSSDGQFLNAHSVCSEFPDGAGGLTVYGEASITGYIFGILVEEYVDFSGLDRCPDNTGVSGDGNGKIRDYSISVNGVMVDATCTGQAFGHGSGKAQHKVPGQKPQNFSEHWNEYWTPNPENNACVITATDENGNTETYGSYASARDDSHYLNSNRQ